MKIVLENGELDVVGMLGQESLHPIKKALLIRLWEASGSDGKLSAEELAQAGEVVKEIKDSALSNWSTVGIVAALFGITAATMIVAPLQQSPFYAASEFVSPDTVKILDAMYVALCAICACSSIVSIFVSVIFTIVISSWMATTSDCVWFLLTFNLALPGIFMGVASFAFLLAMIVSFFICYSVTTASIAAGISGIFCLVLVIVVGGVAKQSADRIAGTRKTKLLPGSLTKAASLGLDREFV